MTPEPRNNTIANSVLSVRTPGGDLVIGPVQPDTPTEYDGILFELNDGRKITLETDDSIIDNTGNYIGRIHAIRHLGGMDGWGYAVYLERPTSGDGFGRSEGVKLADVVTWFEERTRTTAC
jgi:hypothetical protein